MRKLWTRISAFFAAVLLAVFGGYTYVTADDVNLSWTNATQYEDATPLPVSEIANTTLYYSFTALGDTPPADPVDPAVFTELDSVPASQTDYLHANQANGIHCYYATHTATNGETSVPSNLSCKTVDVRRPGAPEGFTAN